LEATHDSDYSGNDPLIQAQYFSKVVGSNDKITIVSVDNQVNPEKNKSVENKPTDNYFKSDEEFKEFLLQYFQQKNIKSIKLEGDKLIIKYNTSQTETKNINSSSKLQQTKAYLKKIGKQELSLSDLEQSNHSNNHQPFNYSAFLTISSVILVLVVFVVVFIKRNSK